MFLFSSDNLIKLNSISLTLTGIKSMYLLSILLSDKLNSISFTSVPSDITTTSFLTENFCVLSRLICSVDKYSGLRTLFNPIKLSLLDTLDKSSDLKATRFDTHLKRNLQQI